jgi:hypothetical protein
MITLSLNEWLSVLGSTILFVGLLAAIWQVHLLAKQTELNIVQMANSLDWSRKEATFEYLARYRTELRYPNLELQKRLDILRQDGSAPLESAIKLLMQSDEARVQLFEMLFYFEHLAIGIMTGFFDDGIAREFLGNVVPTTYKSLLPYLQIRRQETNSTIGAHFEALAIRWERENASSDSPSFALL